MNPYRLSTHRGPHGEVLITRTYSNFIYSVTMTREGEIEVKHGDWLSKYSSAMYNDYTHIHEFARMDSKGTLKRIEGRHALNHIYAGETLYHIPTYNQAHPMMMDEIDIQASPLSEEEEEKIIRDTLKDEYDLQGEQLEWLVSIDKWYHRGHTVVGEIGVEVIADSAGWIAEGTALAGTVATGMLAFGVLAGALTGIGIGIEVLNATQANQRLAGMQAIGYAITAWAFDDPIPGYPAQMRRHQMSFPGIRGVQEAEPAWNAACDAAVRNLEAKVKEKQRSKESYQLFWRAIGKFDRKTLVKMLMDVRAEELDGVQKDFFRGLDPTQYPN